jgi:hypothetical protein
MRRFIFAVVTLLVSAAPFASAENPPVVRRNGRYVVQWKDDRAQVVLGLRYADSLIGGPWLMIETHIAATSNDPIRIDREDIALVVPGGIRVPLASQKAVSEGLGDTKKMFVEASIRRDPLEGYFVGPQRQERLGFFSPPNERIVYDQVTVDRNTISSGQLLFRAPEGKFPPGRYVLEIFSKEIDVKLPFVLPADEPSDKGKKGKDDKSVPW